MGHRLHTCIQDAWKNFIEQDIEVKTVFNQMMSVRAYVHRSSDSNSKLLYKIPNDCVTRPWTGYHKLFFSFYHSYDDIEKLNLNNSHFEMPTNKSLIKILLDCFNDFTPIFCSMQTISKPTMHLALMNLMKIRNLLEKWPMRVKTFKVCLIEALKAKYCLEMKISHVISTFLYPNLKSMSKFKEFNGYLFNVDTATTDVVAIVKCLPQQQARCVSI